LAFRTLVLTGALGAYLLAPARDREPAISLALTQLEFLRGLQWFVLLKTPIGYLMSSQSFDERRARFSTCSAALIPEIRSASDVRLRFENSQRVPNPRGFPAFYG
jgi:hypothetical protein